MPRRPFLRGPDAVLLALTLVAAAALGWFLATEGLTDSATAGDTSTPSGSSTTAAGGGASTSISSTIPITTAVAAETTTTTAVALPPPESLGIEVITDGLDQPLFATTAPGDDRIFVVERTGRIRIVDPGTGEVASDPFLDLSSKTLASKGIELGLLGLAFHPGYEENGRFFVYYTDTSNDTAVAEYSRANADTADAESGRIFVRVDRDGLRHNAGMLQFGPDGHLWIAIGDGGLFEVYGQDNTQFLGTILRLDVDGPEPYGIPPDNPYVDGGGAPEVWAYGLRNPWRFDIDHTTGTIYIGDVGQANAEEINAVPLSGGWNFGWPITEGFDCWQTAGCETTGLTPPITTYSHAEGCSVTGGVVYRGAAIPELTGHYFYADWCFGWVRTFLLSDGTVTAAADWSDDIGEVGMITSFGVDAAGEVLVTTFEGALGRIVASR